MLDSGSHDVAPLLRRQHLRRGENSWVSRCCKRMCGAMVGVPHHLLLPSVPTEHELIVSHCIGPMSHTMLLRACTVRTLGKRLIECGEIQIYVGKKKIHGEAQAPLAPSPLGGHQSIVSTATRTIDIRLPGNGNVRARNRACLPKRITRPRGHSGPRNEGFCCRANSAQSRQSKP